MRDLVTYQRKILSKILSSDGAVNRSRSLLQRHEQAHLNSPDQCAYVPAVEICSI